MSFSVSELSQLAAGWGVHLDRQGSVDDTARALVRALTTAGRLDAFVERLREEKPLVVWPEPRPVAAAPTREAAPEAPPSAAAATAPTIEAPGSLPAPLVDPYLAGDLEPEPGPSGGARMALVAAGVALGLGLGALAMWLAFRDDAAPPETPAVGSPAIVAAQTLRQSVDAVVEACEGEPDDDSARSALTAAFERCNRREMRPSTPDLPPSPPPERPTPRPSRIALPRPNPPPTSARHACLDDCHDQHQACRQSRCGEEPTSATEYPRYQQCLGECMGPYARCRLTCR